MFRKTADVLCCRVGGGCVPENHDTSSSSSSLRTDRVNVSAAGEGSVSGGGRRRRRQHGLASVAALTTTQDATASPPDVTTKPKPGSLSKSTGKSTSCLSNVFVKCPFNGFYR